MKKPLISFVVLSWNTLEDTKICIENILDLSYPNKQIVVVDNGSTDGSKKFLERLDSIVYVDLPHNTGFTGGQIEALKHCHGEYVALINSDAVLARNWADECLHVFKTNEKVAVVGGKVFEWNDHSRAHDTSNQFFAYQTVDPFLGYAETARAGESQVEVDSISGAAVMVSASVINKIGYFDDRFFAYFEETDLFARYQRAGYKIIYQPSAHAWHQIAKSSKSTPFFYLYQMHRNRFLYGFKNFDDGLSFTKRYSIDAISAHKRYLGNKTDDDRARIKAFWWNVAHFFPTLLSRKEVLKLGSSYNEKLESHKPGNDITIIIPSYNYDQYLAEAIESALKQTLRAERIIVIDDGSTDNSVALAKKYKGVEVISKNNEGVVRTKNLGVKLSTTTWTLFLDADDVLSKDYLEKTYKTAVEKNASVIYTDMKFTGSKNGTYEAGAFKMSRLLGGNFIHNSALLSTSLLKTSGGYKNEMSKGYEDWELYLTCAELGATFAYCPHTYLEYRQHEGSLGRNAEAIIGADILWAMVKSLHQPLYYRLAKEKNSMRRFLRQVKRYPSLIIICIILIPYSLVKGLLGYFRFTKFTYVHSIRTYIHYRQKS